jgi:dTDP-4-amino-4,6-dideoxygalactose transaminase
MKPIRIGDFNLSKEEKELIMKILDCGKITEGKETKEFERTWAEKIGTRYSIAVNSGTSALISGLEALKYVSGDKKRKKVITTPLTFISDPHAIRLTGLTPVFGDIDRETFGILPSEIERILEKEDPSQFLAVLPVHLLGYPCDMKEINRIAKKYNLFVFEDCAQSHGSLYEGKVTGSLSDLSAFSFYIAHNIQVGELGAVNTNNQEIRNLVKKIKAYGRRCNCDICTRMDGTCPEILKHKGTEDFDPRFTFDILGYNFKTLDIITALAASRANQVEEIKLKRLKNIAFLNESLRKHEKALQLPVYSEDVSYLAYPLIVKEGYSRKIIREKLEKNKIETRPIFQCIPTQQPAYSDLKEEYQGKLPNAEYIGSNGFYVGCHQYLSQEDLEFIVKSFDDILK